MYILILFFSCMCSAQLGCSCRLMGNTVIWDQLQHKGLTFRRSFLCSTWWLRLRFDGDTDDLQYVENEGRGQCVLLKESQMCERWRRAEGSRNVESHSVLQEVLRNSCCCRDGDTRASPHKPAWTVFVSKTLSEAFFRLLIEGCKGCFRCSKGSFTA